MRLSNNKNLWKLSSQTNALRRAKKKMTDKELLPHLKYRLGTESFPPVSLGMHTYTRLSTESFSFIECRHFFQLDTAECT